MKDVIIKIKGIQGIDENEEEVIELTTVGKISEVKDGYELIYDESELMGAKNIKTKLTVNKNAAVMERSGEMSSKLVIEKGVRNNCFYSTPHGDLMIGIFGEAVECDIKGENGKIFLCYTIDSNLQPISRNKVEITLRKVENKCQ